MFLRIIAINGNPIIAEEIIDTDFTFRHKFKFNYDVEANTNDQYYEELIDFFVKVYEINNSDVPKNLLIWYNTSFEYDEWKSEFRKHLKAQYPNYYDRFEKLLILQ